MDDFRNEIDAFFIGPYSDIFHATGIVEVLGNGNRYLSSPKVDTMTDTTKPFFKAKEFVTDNQHGDAVWIIAERDAEIANAKVRPLLAENASLLEKNNLLVYAISESEKELVGLNVLIHEIEGLREQVAKLKEGLIDTRSWIVDLETRNKIDALLGEGKGESK